MQEFGWGDLVARETDENHLIIERMDPVDLARVDRLVESSRSIPEQVYEGCMHARICENEGERATLVIRFTAGLDIERLPIHRHAFSSRKIQVVSGEGTFHFQDPRTGRLETVTVDRGTYVGFPKGLYHTFTTSQSEMTVVAVHDPFQKLDDEQILEHGHGFEKTSTGRTEVRLPLRLPLP
jgi:hypothetical protein